MGPSGDFGDLLRALQQGQQQAQGPQTGGPEDDEAANAAAQGQQQDPSANLTPTQQAVQGSQTSNQPSGMAQLAKDSLRSVFEKSLQPAAMFKFEDPTKDLSPAVQTAVKGLAMSNPLVSGGMVAKKLTDLMPEGTLEKVGKGGANLAASLTGSPPIFPATHTQEPQNKAIIQQNGIKVDPKTGIADHGDVSNAAQNQAPEAAKQFEQQYKPPTIQAADQALKFHFKQDPELDQVLAQTKAQLEQVRNQRPTVLQYITAAFMGLGGAHPSQIAEAVFGRSERLQQMGHLQGLADRLQAEKLGRGKQEQMMNFQEAQKERQQQQHNQLIQALQGSKENIAGSKLNFQSAKEMMDTASKVREGHVKAMQQLTPNQPEYKQHAAEVEKLDTFLNPLKRAPVAQQQAPVDPRVSKLVGPGGAGP